MRIGGMGMLVLVLGLAGCASLITRAPAGFDLNGTWTLLPSMSDDPPDAAKILREQDQRYIQGRVVDSTASDLFITRDFPVLTAQRLEIEQDARSMGIRYGGGGYRDITWGTHEYNAWTVRAGWDVGALVLRSSRSGIRGVERMSLTQGGTRLVVEVDIKTERDGFSATRVFERSNGP